MAIAIGIYDTTADLAAAAWNGIGGWQGLYDATAFTFPPFYLLGELATGGDFSVYTNTFDAVADYAGQAYNFMVDGMADALRTAYGDAFLAKHGTAAIVAATAVIMVGAGIAGAGVAAAAGLTGVAALVGGGAVAGGLEIAAMNALGQGQVNVGQVLEGAGMGGGMGGAMGIAGRVLKPVMQPLGQAAKSGLGKVAGKVGQKFNRSGGCFVAGTLVHVVPEHRFVSLAAVVALPPTAEDDAEFDAVWAVWAGALLVIGGAGWTALRERKRQNRHVRGLAHQAVHADSHQPMAAVFADGELIDMLDEHAAAVAFAPAGQPDWRSRTMQFSQWNSSAPVNGARQREEFALWDFRPSTAPSLCPWQWMQHVTEAASQLADAGRRRGWFASLWLSIFVLLAAGCLWRAFPLGGAGHSSGSAVVASVPALAPSGETHHASAAPRVAVEAPAVMPIAEVRLGQRVVGRNPQLSTAERTAIADPDTKTWRHVRLVLDHPDGGRVDVDLLRPLEWVEAIVAVEGRTIFLDLEELGAAGAARVMAVAPCPPIQPGPDGNVVTGLFRHTSGELLNLTVEGPQPIGTTPNHLFWSEDRQAFVPACELEIGKRLLGSDGRPVALVSISRRGPPGPVYNLEVHGEHVFRVGSRGILVHNSSPGLARPDLHVHHNPGNGAKELADQALKGKGRTGESHNAALFAQYKDALRAQMQRPHVTDATLARYMDELYRAAAQVGSGSTAAAVRYELATGAKVGGRTHSEKARNYVKAITRWLRDNPNASAGDRAAAENVLRDLLNALEGR